MLFILMSSGACWLDDMEIVFAPACVNVGVAGVLFFLSFVMGFQRPCRVDVYKRQQSELV